MKEAPASDPHHHNWIDGPPMHMDVTSRAAPCPKVKRQARSIGGQYGHFGMSGAIVSGRIDPVGLSVREVAL